MTKKNVSHRKELISVDSSIYNNRLARRALRIFSVMRTFRKCDEIE